MREQPKYSRWEIERKWLIDKARLPELSGLKCFEIEDKYFVHTRMRLRKVLEPENGKITYKLGKKYGKVSEVAEPITNIYLSEIEFNKFNKLPGRLLKKNRYHYPFEDELFSIDHLIHPHDNLFLLEIEKKSEEAIREIKLPSFIGEEVTNVRIFEGYELSKGNKIF